MSASQIKVLIVDDDYRVAAIHAAYVERTPGFLVVGQAHNAVQARDLAASLLPDLILMDIYLPDGNGLDVVRTLLEQPQPPDVIVISAARELAAVRAAMQLGAVHYLVKPFGYQVLADRLQAYQRLRRRIEGIDGTPSRPTSTNCSDCSGRPRCPSPVQRRGTRHQPWSLSAMRFERASRTYQQPRSPSRSASAGPRPNAT